MIYYHDVKTKFNEKNKVEIPKQFFELLDSKIQECFDGEQSKFYLYRNDLDNIKFGKASQYNKEQAENFKYSIAKEYISFGWNVVVQYLFETQYQSIEFIFKQGKPNTRSLKDQDL